MKALALFLLCLPTFSASHSYTVTAYWTGGIEHVTTVSQKSGVSCEYIYGSTTFWRTFVGSTCPATVEVE